MTSDNIKGAHGGKREGSGRKPTGRKRQQYYVTDEENEQIKEFIEQLRGNKNE